MNFRSKPSNRTVLAALLIAVAFMSAVPQALLAQLFAVPVVFKNQICASLRVELEAVVDIDEGSFLQT